MTDLSQPGGKVYFQQAGKTHYVTVNTYFSCFQTQLSRLFPACGIHPFNQPIKLRCLPVPSQMRFMYLFVHSIVLGRLQAILNTFYFRGIVTKVLRNCLDIFTSRDVQSKSLLKLTVFSGCQLSKIPNSHHSAIRRKCRCQFRARADLFPPSVKSN